MLEEDIALSNLGLDLIGQARLLYAYAGEVEGKGRGEDALAYLRDEHAYANLLLVEQPNGDFAATMVRQLLYAAFMHPYLQALQTSADARLAEIAAKAVKEMAYHVRHAAEWVIRLGDGTEESHARAAAALDELWMYTGELFEMDGGERGAGRAGHCRRPRGDQAGLGGNHRSRARRGDVEAPGRPLDADAAAAAAATASTWATCWPRCRCCTAPIPARRGEAADGRARRPQNPTARSPQGGGDPTPQHERRAPLADLRPRARALGMPRPSSIRRSPC